MTVINKILTYACGAWAYNLNKTEQKLLQKLQRPFLLRISRCYKTTPTSSLFTLTGIPPLNIQIKYDSLQSKLLNINTNSCIFENKRISEKRPTTHLAPYNRNFNITTFNPKSKRDQFEIYTDGSKSEDGVGYAFLVLKNNNEIYNQQIKLHNNNSIFQAEYQAILSALQWIKKNHNNLNINSINILSDSLSTITAIKSFNQKHYALQNIQSLLFHLSNKLKITITWIKAHSNHFGNEKADTYAKQSTLKTKIDQILPLPSSYIKRSLNKKLILEWQNYWTNEITGRLTYKYIPKISLKHLFKSPHLNCLISNHGPFPEFLFRFRLGDCISENCICGQTGNSEHYMFDCTLTSNFHFKKPNQLNYYIWTIKMNNNKFLLNKAKNLINWLSENENNIQNTN